MDPSYNICLNGEEDALHAIRDYALANIVQNKVVGCVFDDDFFTMDILKQINDNLTKPNVHRS